MEHVPSSSTVLESISEHGINRVCLNFFKKYIFIFLDRFDVLILKIIFKNKKNIILIHF
jgi:hypothetical protein